VSAVSSARAKGADRVLVVDDEADLRDLVAFTVREAGFVVDSVGTGREALDAARAEPPAVVVLDLMLPDMLGTAVCGALRHDPVLSDVGILMLTARGGELDRVEGLEAGADDYLVKPFNARELVLRVRTLVRRTRDSRIARASQERPSLLKWRGIELDVRRHRVEIDAVPITLRPLELKLLATFLGAPGTVFSRPDLLRLVWGIDEPTDSRTVDTHIRRLRERLGAYSGAIETAHGFGYRLKDESADDA
jgi:two-component system phosphate regulon response regulator PhoB